jgi:hypothetical protein
MTAVMAWILIVVRLRTVALFLRRHQGAVARKFARSCAVAPAGSEDPYPTILLTVVSQAAAVLPLTVYPPALNTVVFEVSPWHPVHAAVT